MTRHLMPSFVSKRGVLASIESGPLQVISLQTPVGPACLNKGFTSITRGEIAQDRRKRVGDSFDTYYVVIPSNQYI
jgi:hypothetical protein